MDKQQTNLSAVILAAGMGTRLRDIVGEKPKGLLQLDGKELIVRSLELLQEFGIQNIVMVTGYNEEQYLERLQTEFPQVRFLCNKDYSITGSMHSLFLAQEALPSDFLLLESDLFYEKRALSTLIETPQESAILLSGKTNSGDEVYVYGKDNQIELITKKPSDEFTLQGELVGISKISADLYGKMCHHYKESVTFPSDYHYENCISDLSAQRPTEYLKVEDLVWTEIDDPSHYQRALDQIVPRVRENDQKFSHVIEV